VIEVKRKGVSVRLRPSTLEGVQCLYVDVNSVAAALKDPEELFRSMASFPGRAVLVVDAWHETHLPLARRYLELCRKWMVDCVLSESKPAESLAAELACRDRCAVLSRDVDVVKTAGGCEASIFLFLRGRLWLVEATTVHSAASTESFKADAQ